MNTPATPPTPAPQADPDLDSPSGNPTLDALDDLIAGVLGRGHFIPPWEFFDGFLTALLCTRRSIPQQEWLPVAMEDEDPLDVFANEAELTRFLMLWQEREAQIRAALEADIERLEEEDLLQPAVLDWRGMHQAIEAELLSKLDAQTQAKADPQTDPQTDLNEDLEKDLDADLDADLKEYLGEDLEDDLDEGVPSLGQQWASGFFFAVMHWTDDWAAPRDKEVAQQIGDALRSIEQLIFEDSDPPALNLCDPSAPPSVSEERVMAMDDAIWAVHELYTIAKSLGPRTLPARSDKVGRNDPCPCGSGKKYKKCCGA